MVGSFSEGKSYRNDTDRSTQSSGEVKKVSNFAFSSPYVFMQNSGDFNRFSVFDRYQR
jgi:hypothetical protein